MTVVLVLGGRRLPLGIGGAVGRDQCYPPDLQARSADRIGAGAATLDAGHMAMVTMPDQVAGILRGLAS